MALCKYVTKQSSNRGSIKTKKLNYPNQTVFFCYRIFLEHINYNYEKHVCFEN